MAITKTVKVGQISVTEFKCLEVRTDTIIEEDGVELSRSYHRHVVAPGQDVTGEDAEVQSLASLLHTQQVIDDYNAMVAANQI